MHAKTPHPLVTFDHASFSYGSRCVLESLSLEIPQNSLIAIIGPNGGGKSTFLKAIMRFLDPDSGQMTFAPEVKDRIAYLPQSLEVDRHFPLTVQELVGMGLWHHLGPFASLKKHHEKRIEDALHQVNLWGLRHNSIKALSGGQWQRVLFARAIVQDAEMILLDEPFNAVDEKTEDYLVNLMLDWHRGGKTLLVSLHESELVKRVFRDVVVLNGSVIEYGPVSEVMSDENMEKMKGKHL